MTNKIIPFDMEAGQLLASTDVQERLRPLRDDILRTHALAAAADAFELALEREGGASVAPVLRRTADDALR